MSVGSLADDMLSSKTWFFICSHRRWSELLCSRRCLHDHSHQTLKKETLQYTPQLVKTVAKEIMKVESSKQIRSQTCCSVTIDSKSHLVAPAVSIDDYPVIQEDAHRRLVKKNSKPWTWLLRKSGKQPEPQCLVCTLNSAILILKEWSILFEENTHTDSSLQLPKSSVAVHVKKVRDEDYVQWLLEFFTNLAHVFKLTYSSGSIQC